MDNDNANSLNVHFWLGAGSDFTGGTFNNGTWSTTANTRVSSNHKLILQIAHQTNGTLQDYN